MALTLYNSLSKKEETLVPIHGKSVGLYTCGPTVYNFAHIGNLRTYLFEDILRRVLVYGGYTVTHVMNITDVGHLTDDADAGEDKMEKGSRREGKSAWDIAAFYTQKFLEDIEALNIKEADVLCKATDHIPEQIALVEKLSEKGFTYETGDGIYFDTSKLDDYGKLVDLDKQSLKAGARVAVGEKRNIHDFALWKFTPEGESRQMEWEAFGKKGFPGWHIECSAMSIKYLGEHFDIHTGGVDHKPIHHTNEIAQSEAATGIVPWVNYWLHGEFLTIAGNKDDGETKMAKSGEGFITLQSLREKGIEPLGYRFWLLTAHYRRQVAFTYEALQAAETAYKRFKEQFLALGNTTGVIDEKSKKQFTEAVENDLDMPRALTIAWEVLKSETITSQDKKATLLDFDMVLGLGLSTLEEETVPAAILALAKKRDLARDAKDFSTSDALRDEIEAQGFRVKDTSHGTVVEKPL